MLDNVIKGVVVAGVAAVVALYAGIGIYAYGYHKHERERKKGNAS